MVLRVLAIKVLLIWISIAVPAAGIGTVALVADAEETAENLTGEAEKATAISKLNADIKAVEKKRLNAVRHGDRNAAQQLVFDLKLLKVELSKARSKPLEKYAEEAAERKRIGEENMRLASEYKRKEAENKRKEAENKRLLAELPKNIDEIKTLTVDQANALAEHIGWLPDTDQNVHSRFKRLRLNGLATLSDEVASVLAQPTGFLNLDGLTTLSPGAAKALAQHDGSLSLDGLTTLSDEAARALGQRKVGVSLDGLTTLSEEAAKALAQVKGDLYLRGLTTPSDEVAQALEQHTHRGRLFLASSHADFSDTAATMQDDATQDKEYVWLNWKGTCGKCGYVHYTRSLGDRPPPGNCGGSSNCTGTTTWVPR
jgi:hypothetical protein